MARNAGPALRRAAPARFDKPVGVGDLVKPPLAALEPDRVANHDMGTLTAFPQAKAVVNEWSFDHVTVEDTDQLWDWVRADRPGTTGFLGVEHKNSQSFNNHVGASIQNEAAGTAWFRAIKMNGQLVGFLALTLVNQSASVSLYVEPDHRAAIPSIVAEAVRVMPLQLALVVVTTDDDIISAFSAEGFERKTVLTRPPTSTGAERDGR